MAGRGNPKTGGRPPGRKNRRTLEMEEWARRAAEEGVSPLQYMLRVMRDVKVPVERRDEMAKAAAPYVLVVKHAFADYQIGQEITDAAEVAAVLAGENLANVLKRAV